MTRSFAVLALSLALPTGQVIAQNGAGADAITVYENARVWNGENFQQRSFLVQDGKITDASEADIAAISAASPNQTVDLAGKFVVPAYANSHVHITNAADWSSNGYLEKGVYYLWNPTVIDLGEGAKEYFARPDTFDVKTARGGITEPGGHPERLYVERLGPSVYNGRTDFLGDAFHYGRTREEIIAALDLLVEQGAEFVKGYLLSSEEYEKRRDDNENYYGNKGMNPENAAFLVEEAAKRDLLVTFHVETAHDLVVAAEAGAFAAMHLPGYGLFREADVAVSRTLRPDQAEIVANSGMWLIPTYGIAPARAEQLDTDLGRSRAALAFAVQRHNLAVLKEAGGKFLVGTDGFTSILPELTHIDGLGVFSRPDLLNQIFTTGATLFPERTLGCLAPGCEADFLVLNGNPLDDLTQLEAIEMRIKAGKALSL
ncbi:MAG: amidohydrolase family protein [Pseudomonadota bacterium]